jgi:CRP-like cAMP-binding protein
MMKSAILNRKMKESVEAAAFAPIPSTVSVTLDELPQPYIVRAGTVLLHQQSHPHSVFLISQGVAKLLFTAQDGIEFTIGLRTAGWYVGATFVFTETLSIYSVVLVTDCMVSEFPSRSFVESISKSPARMEHLLSTMCSESLSLASSQAMLMIGSAEDRLGSYLTERSLASDSTVPPGITYSLQQKELAQLLAISPEHLSRLSKKSTGSVGRKRK